MYSHPFRYHRAGTLDEAVTLLSELGEEAKVIAGGQSLIPLMKLRFAAPGHLIDLNFIPGLSYIREEDDRVRLGALTRHAEVEHSELARSVPIIGDCAGGIADVQVRNRGTVGGSLAEADPSGDWAPVLLTLGAEVHCRNGEGERRLPLSEFLQDTYTTALKESELLSEVSFAKPPQGSGGAYLAFKRSAQVYPTAGAAVQLTVEDGGLCRRAGIALGSVGLTTIRASEAEKELEGQTLSAQVIERAAEAAMHAAQPQSDTRGSEAYKKTLVRALVKRAVDLAVRRARGEKVKGSHYYG